MSQNVMAPPAKLVRRASKPVVEKTKPEKHDVGTVGSPFVTATVKQKVRKWQTTGGGVVTADDGVVDASDRDDTTNSTRQTNATSTEKSASTVEKEDSVADDQNVIVVIEDEDEEEDGNTNSRQRRKTVGDARIVDWPSTPVRKASIPQPPATDPAPGAAVGRDLRPRNLDDEMKRASAPRKRVVSDGHWRRQRNPPKSPPKKPPTPPPPPKPRAAAQMGWVRPPLLPRKDPNEEIPKPKPVELPPMKVFTGALRKPIFHSFVPGTKTALPKEEEKELAERRWKRRSTRTRSLSWDGSESESESEAEVTTPRRKSSRFLSGLRRTDALSGTEDRKTREHQYPSSPEGVRDSPRGYGRKKSIDDGSDDAIDSQYTIRRDSSIQKSPPLLFAKLGFGNRKTHTGKTRNPEPPEDDARRSTDKSRTQSGRRRSPTRRHSFDGLSEAPSRWRAKSTSTGNANPPYEQSMRRDEMRRDEPRHIDELASRRAGNRPTRDQMKRSSYNAGDPVPVLDGIPTGNFHPARVEAWLNVTPDPFVSSSESSRKSPKEPRRMFSFTGGEAESRRGSSASDPVSRKTDGKRTEGSSHKKAVNLKLDDRDSEIEVDYASTSSTPTLKRSGARRNLISPTKDKRKFPGPKEYAESDVTSSVVTSSFVTSSYLTSSVDTASNVTPVQSATIPTSPHRLFPSTGKRLSTIASVDTLNNKVPLAPSFVSEDTDITERPEAEHGMGPPPKTASNLPDKGLIARSSTRKSKNRLNGSSGVARRSKSVISTRSISSHMSRLATCTVADLMTELVGDEDLYMPELRTLTGGVIPVLFRCVLSKSEAAVAAGLFSRFAVDGDKDATRAIHEMGVALERLKRLHHRIPKEDVSELLIWAQGALRIYTEYVRTWRLGFQDVVVNLVPAEDSSVVSGKDVEGGSLANGLPRDDDGYVVNQNGEMVDVAFLLKRPLVRLKYLTKTIKSINFVQPTERSADLMIKFEALVEDARRKINDEKARMEDQSASSIDPSRVRDPKTLVALAGVQIDPKRCVKARDFFEMHLIHSTGQEVISRIEILLRDDAPGHGTGGDVLICQSDDRGRWLFLPPILSKHISCRLGTSENEIIVMIRGVQSRGQVWQELFSLTTNDRSVASEWLQMLRSDPVPPVFTRETIVKETIRRRPVSSHGSSLLSGSVTTGSTAPLDSRSPSPFSQDVPIGEKAGPNARVWGYETPDRTPRSREISPTTDQSSEVSRNERRPSADYRSPPLGSPRDQNRRRKSSGSKENGRDSGSVSLPRDLNEAMRMAGNGSSSLKRTTAKRYQSSPVSPTGPEPMSPASRKKSGRSHRFFSTKGLEPDQVRSKSRRSPESVDSKGYSVWMPSSSDVGNSEDDDESVGTHFSASSSQRPGLHQRSASLPVNDHLMSKVHGSGRFRMDSENSQKRKSMLERSSSRQPDLLDAAQAAPVYTTLPSPSATHSQPTSSSSANHNNMCWPKRNTSSVNSEEPPPPPPHRSSAIAEALAIEPKLTKRNVKNAGLTSSPLKNELQLSSDGDMNSEGFSLESGSDDTNSFSDWMRNSSDELYTLQEDVVGEAATDFVTPSQSASQIETSFERVAFASYWSNDLADYVNLHPAKEKSWMEAKKSQIIIYDALTDERNTVRKRPNTRALIALSMNQDCIISKGTVLDVTIQGPLDGDTEMSRKLNSIGHEGSHVLIMLRLPTKEAADEIFLELSLLKTNGPVRRHEIGANFSKQQDIIQKEATGWFRRITRTKQSFRKPEARTRSGSTVGNTDRSYKSTSSIKHMITTLAGKAGYKYNLDKSTVISMTEGGSPTVADALPNDVFWVSLSQEERSTMKNKFRCLLYRHTPVAREFGEVSLYLLDPRRTELGEPIDVNGPPGLHHGSAVRAVLCNRTQIFVDKVLPPASINTTPRGINIQVYENAADEIAATGGVGNVKKTLYFIQFESNGKRDFAYNLMTTHNGVR